MILCHIGRNNRNFFGEKLKGISFYRVSYAAKLFISLYLVDQHQQQIHINNMQHIQNDIAAPHIIIIKRVPPLLLY